MVEVNFSVSLVQIESLFADLAKSGWHVQRRGVHGCLLRLCPACRQQQGLIDTSRYLSLESQIICKAYESDVRRRTCGLENLCSLARK